MIGVLNWIVPALTADTVTVPAVPPEPNEAVSAVEFDHLVGFVPPLRNQSAVVVSHTPLPSVPAVVLSSGSYTYVAAPARGS